VSQQPAEKKGLVHSNIPNEIAKNFRSAILSHRKEGVKKKKIVGKRGGNCSGMATLGGKKEESEESVGLGCQEKGKGTSRKKGTVSLARERRKRGAEEDIHSERGGCGRARKKTVTSVLP